MKILQVLLFILAMTTYTLAIPGHFSDSGHHIDYYSHPKYHYDYAVHDLHTGDVKNKWETRDGDVVKGAYSLNQPNGTILKVEYTADKHNGYNAVGKSVHPEPEYHHEGHSGYGDFKGHND